MINRNAICTGRYVTKFPIKFSCVIIYAFRGYGAPESEFPFEVCMDELAEKVGMDPFDFRYTNLWKEGDTNPSQQIPDVYCMKEIFDKMRPIYEDSKKRTAARSTDEVKCATGIAFGSYAAGLDGPDSASAWAELNEDGSVTIGAAWGDHGQGATGGILGTAHEALRPYGIDGDRIHYIMNDSSKTPPAGPAGGSRSQVMVGNAIRVSCEMLLAAMKKPEGGWYTRAEMLEKGLNPKQEGTWTAPCKPCSSDTGKGEPFCCYMYGLFLAEVSVEVKTGKTRCDRLVCSCDIGKINNRLIVDGQISGGMAQGVGLALTEDYEDLKRDSTMAGAGIPNIKDILMTSRSSTLNLPVRMVRSELPVWAKCPLPLPMPPSSTASTMPAVPVSVICPPVLKRFSRPCPRSRRAATA